MYLLSLRLHTGGQAYFFKETFLHANSCSLNCICTPGCALLWTWDFISEKARPNCVTK